MTKTNNHLANGFFLHVKNLDISTGYPWIAILNEKDATHLGVRPGDKLTLKWQKRETEIAVDVTETLVKSGEIGLFKEITDEYKIKANSLLELSIAGYTSSLETIQKKLHGQKVSKKEIYNLVEDIVHYKIDDIELAFFVASAFDRNNFSLQEISYLTQAVADTGEKLSFGKIVADKHSIGGTPGNCTTPLVVSMIASAGIHIPKTSSRAVTSAAGTADAMEVLMPVDLSIAKIKQVVKKTNGCLVWGGAVKLAPADDRFIKLCYQLGTEPLSKMVVSIMAKKYAAGATNLVIDMPIGPTAKMYKKEDVEWTKKIFLYVAKQCHIKIHIAIQKVKGPVGRGVGPALKARDVLRVLEQDSDRPLDLENKAIHLAGLLLESVGKAKKGKGEIMARGIMASGQALKKFKEIVKAQGGNPNITSQTVPLGKIKFNIRARKSGKIMSIENKNITEIARLLGAPLTKTAGVYLEKVVGNKVKKNDILATLYCESSERLGLAKKMLQKVTIFNIR